MAVSGYAPEFLYHPVMSDQLASPKMGQWHVAVAAEVVAAALFARCGYDVSVQYGANQPEYDLAVIRGERMLKVSVKGSQDRGWGLTQSYLKKGKANYHEAIDEWLARHKPRTVFCFVQFIDVPVDAMPRVYLATPAEVAVQLKACAGGRGETMLMEKRVWTDRAKHGGKVDQIPESWHFSPARIEQLMATA